MADRNEVVDSFSLDPAIEFERIVIEIVRMHRSKNAGYTTSLNDPYAQFGVIGRSAGLSALTACEVLMAKHSTALVSWRNPNLDPEHTATSDDAMIDRAVYSIIALLLYRREANSERS